MDVQIMGIVNLTDDSYFADSRCLATGGNLQQTAQNAVRRVRQMLDEGADIIDVGACSTRPGSDPVGAEEEWRRLEPALSAIREEFPDVRISVDTYWSSVVRKTYDLIGDFLANDISAGEDDPEMLPAVGEMGLEYVAMHKRGDSKTMTSLCQYDDVTAAVLDYFRDFEDKARANGISRWILDPGFGFAKTVEQNYQLLRELDRFQIFHRPILVGISRKSMIYRYFGITPEEALPATQVLHWYAKEKGAGILRVHDVAEAARTLALPI